MPFSYGKFLEKISLSKARVGGRAPAGSDGGPRPTGSEASPPTETATAAADSLQAHAVLLPDLPAPSEPPADGTEAIAGRLDSLLASLWHMTDDLARIRAEFHLHSDDPGHSSGPAPVPDGGYRMDEREGVIAQVDALERSICNIVAVLAGPDDDENAAGRAQSFIERVDRQRRDVVARTSETVRQLRLQAIQLAAAVHAYRSSLALARDAIAQARR